ncbi:MAG TPA: zinc metalloprotease HtpX [bacterium]|nr:zinc metalloprotease HtpX [bacterium]HPN94796.1 zinc metalloprotease HtpX [bacterium]
MNTLKTTFLMGALFGFFLLVGGLMGGEAGMAFAFVVALVMNFTMYWFSDRIVLAMYKAKELPPDIAPRLHAMVAKLSVAAGIPAPRVYLVPMPVPNAFATGRNPANGVVAVTQGLLDILDEAEVEGVIAHEIGHIKNRDTLISCLAAAMAGAIMMLASMARWAAIFGGRDNRGNVVTLIATAVFAPIAAMLIQMAISRSREYMADDTAARLTRNPRGLATALAKLETVSKRHPIRGGNSATAHMFIVNPFAGGALAGLFSTHPPIAERIKRLEKAAF